MPYGRSNKDIQDAAFEKRSGFKMKYHKGKGFPFMENDTVETNTEDVDYNEPVYPEEVTLRSRTAKKFGS